MSILVIVGLWLALLGAMIGSLQHVAWSFSTMNGGKILLGYVQAGAVDIGIAALAFAIQVRKRAGHRSVWLWTGVVLFCAVSTYANLLYGLENMSSLTRSGVLASWRPFIMSAVLPLMVIYLSEVVSADMKERVKDAERVAKRERQRGERQSPAPLPAPPISDMTKEEALSTLTVLLTAHPDMSVSELARRIGKSRGTVYNYLMELEHERVSSSNGHRDPTSVR